MKKVKRQHMSTIKGYLTLQSNPDGTSEKYTYDENDNVTSKHLRMVRKKPINMTATAI